MESNVLCIKIVLFRLSFGPMCLDWISDFQVTSYCIYTHWINWQTRNKNWSGSNMFFGVVLEPQFCGVYALLVYTQVILSIPFTFTILCILLLRFTLRDWRSTVSYRPKSVLHKTLFTYCACIVCIQYWIPLFIFQHPSTADKVW